MDKALQEGRLQMFLYISEILGKAVIDENGVSLGKLADLKLRLGELFPKVIALLIKKRPEKQLLCLDWAEVESLSGSRISLRPGAAGRMRAHEERPDEILLKEELLDKQVVDTFGAKIERVNDIHLLLIGTDLHIVHVDIGIRGLLRRLGWIKAVDFLTNWLFAFRFPEKMISWKYVQPLASEFYNKCLKLNVNLQKIHELHPSDIADILEDLDQENRKRIFKSLDLQTAAETLEEVDPKLQASLIEAASVEMASDILEEMAPDEATDLLADLPEEKMQRLIQTMEKPSREKLEELLQFEEGTAGSIMTKDFIAIEQQRTIGDAIEEFKKTTHPLESIAYIYVTNDQGHLIGVLTLRHLLLCTKDMVLGPLMNKNLVKVHPEEEVKKVAGLFRKYKFMAIPVVDGENHLAGIITLQDIVDAESREA
jgi:magnesium transporter